MSFLSIVAVFVSLFIMSRALGILREEGQIHEALARAAQGLGIVAMLTTMLGLIVLTVEARELF